MEKQTLSCVPSVANRDDETVIHLFAYCTKSTNLWKNIKTFFQESLIIPSLTPQSAMFGQGYLSYSKSYFANIQTFNLLLKRIKNAFIFQFLQTS